MKIDNLILSQRFCGPPKTGNGGFTAGILVEAAGTETAEIRLLNPTPVETSISVESEKGLRGIIYDDTILFQCATQRRYIIYFNIISYLSSKNLFKIF